MMGDSIVNDADVIYTHWYAIVEQGHFPMFVITNKTEDYGDQFVARIAYVSDGAITNTPYVCTAWTLNDIRKYKPRDLMIMHRMPNDDKVIVETWM